jgi:hypothetical protein
VAKTIQDLLPVVHASEKDGKNPDLGQRLIDLKVENKSIAGHGTNGGSDLRVLGTAVRVILKSPHVDQGFVYAAGRPHLPHSPSRPQDPGRPGQGNPR